MEQTVFEGILDRCCGILTEEARSRGFRSPKEFENRVRVVLNDNSPFQIDFNSPAQAFPDIAMDEYGVEVKFTLNDTWRSVANSILENQRVASVRHIYVIFGKMGGTPAVRWRSWEDSVVHVRTSHVPRFEVELSDYEGGRRPRLSLFKQMGISYDDFRQLGMPEKMKYVRSYAKRLHPDEHLWWIEDNDDELHSTGLARLYTSLTTAERNMYRAEAALLCPEIVKTGRSRNKYDRLVIFLLTYHGIVCHQARDLFSAGSVGNPDNLGSVRNYIENALRILESDMREAAFRLDDRLFVEYWGESCPPQERIGRWLEKADSLAVGWKPSESLFVRG